VRDIRVEEDRERAEERGPRPDPAPLELGVGGLSDAELAGEGVLGGGGAVAGGGQFRTERLPG
jgi:hypothetical protein